MGTPPALPERTRVRRDMQILRWGAAVYVVVVVVGGHWQGLRWWVVGALVLAVFPLVFAAMRILTYLVLREIAAHPPSATLARGASPSEFEDVIDPAELAGFEDFCWLRTANGGRRDLVGPVRYARTADGAVVVSVGSIGNATAISRLDDGRWFVTQWIRSFPLPGVVVQVAPNAPLGELLLRHRDALRQAAARGRSTSPVAALDAAEALQQLENQAIAAMSGGERRRATGLLARGSPGESFDPAVF